MSGIKHDILSQVSASAGVSVRKARKILQLATELFKDTLDETGRVEVRGIGTFRTGYVGMTKTVFFTQAHDIFNLDKDLDEPDDGPD